uniref:Spermidine synthase n=1 Tax=Syphacia muris TaxID=451379 RepID=A0A158R3R8_9BILA
MDQIKDGWFTELSPDQRGPSQENSGGSWRGQAFSLQIKKILFHEKSKYQDVLVFESESYGNVLVLDGIIQCTDRDEFAYQEMLTHLAMCSHPCPSKVLIIGGGDGGVLREVLKHESVELVTMCEIDQMVIDVAKKYLPNMSSAFNSSKLKLHVGDGMEFLKHHPNEFDVIITDSSDPVGPAENLFGKGYYELLKEALRTGGVLSSQGECPWLDMKLIREVVSTCKKLFGSVAYAISSVPTYTTGLMGYFVCIKDEVSGHVFLQVIANLFLNYFVMLFDYEGLDPSTPMRLLTESDKKKMNLRYYSSEIHKASFILPEFIRLEFVAGYFELGY